MTRPASRLSLAALAFAAAALAAALPARAQGTEEQQDACAPDAFKLCQKAIPDIPKTTACMKAHYAQLSPRCQRAFNDVTGGGGGEKSAPADVARGEPGAAPPPPVAVAPPQDDDVTGTVAAPSDSPMRSYAAQIRSYCREGLIDPFTCRNTLAVLHDSE